MKIHGTDKLVYKKKKKTSNNTKSNESQQTTQLSVSKSHKMRKGMKFGVSLQYQTEAHNL